jgi:hypothetical protein
MPTARPDNCQKDLFRWGQEYSHQVSNGGWNYRERPALTSKHQRDAWSYCVKSQYDLDRRLGRVFHWSRHRQRTEISPQLLSSEFKTYADRWWKETRILSSIQAKIFNQNYQRIIGMGRQVLPLIFADLKRRGGQWYWALECITGENPAAAATTLDEARKQWLDYGIEKGHLSE